MNSSQLEHALRAWFQEEQIDTAAPPPSLLPRVLGIPDRQPRRSWSWPWAIRLDRRSLVVALVLLLAAAIAGTVLVGTMRQLLTDRRPSIGALEPCNLLTDEDLAALFGGEWRTLDGFPDTNWYVYSRDWVVPQAAELVFGEGTRHCEYTGAAPRGNHHVELFARARSTSTDQATSLVEVLYGTACAQKTARGVDWPDICSPARRDLDGVTTWLSTVEADPGHFALALSLEPQLVLVTMGIDVEGDEQLVVPAIETLIIDRLAGADLPVAATPRPGEVRIGDPAPDVAAATGLQPKALQDRVVAVLWIGELPPVDGEVAIEERLVPELEAFVRAAVLADGAGLFIWLAGPEIDRDLLSVRLEASTGVSSLPITLATEPQTGLDPFYWIDEFGRNEPGPNKLVVIDRQGAVAAIYGWVQPEPDELAQIVQELAKEGG